MRMSGPAFRKLRLGQDSRLRSKRAGGSISRGTVYGGVR